MAKLFTVTTGKKANAVIIQFLIDKLFKAIIQSHVTVQTITPGGCSEVTLTYIEQNALRYAAGYIPKHLRSNLKSSAHPLKRELMWRLLDLTDEMDDVTADESEDWLNMIDRGGLQHVTHKTYILLLSMEMALQRSLPTIKVDFKEKVTAAIMKDDDVLFNWVMISGDWESEEADTLFTMITNLWVTIRGFSFASAWVEKYKLAYHQSIQKSKGIRKHLLAGNK